MHNFLDVRYRYDNPEYYGLSAQVDGQASSSKEVLGGLLSNSVRIVPALFPDLAQELEGLNERMMLDRGIDCFVVSNPEIQAYCIPVSQDGTDHFVVVVTSALVERLNPQEIIFVIGHEVGHFIYQHWRHPREDDGGTHGQRLALLQLERSAEISADRVGMIACKSLQASCTAMIKVASGLSEPFLKPDIPSLLQQFREIVSQDGHKAAILSTHPTIPLRIRALLMFDPVLQNFLNSDCVDQDLLEKIDHRVESDFHTSTGNILKKHEDKQLADVQLWGMVSIFVADGIFSKSEQKLFSDLCGGALLKKVVGFLNSNEANIHTAVSKKLKHACSEAIACPRDRKETVISDLKDLFSIENYTGEYEIAELERIKGYLGMA